MQINVLLERDEDGWYVATIPGFEGCISQGETEAEALVNIRDALTLWLESQSEMARRTEQTNAEPHLISV